MHSPLIFFVCYLMFEAYCIQAFYFYNLNFILHGMFIIMIRYKIKMFIINSSCLTIKGILKKNTDIPPATPSRVITLHSTRPLPLQPYDELGPSGESRVLDDQKQKSQNIFSYIVLSLVWIQSAQKTLAPNYNGLILNVILNTH